MPAGHQGSVSNEKTGYHFAGAAYQLPVADYLTSFNGPLGASPGGIADFLSSFKGPHGPGPGLPIFSCMEIFDLFVACFSILHVFICSSQNTPQKGSKIVKKLKNYQKNIHPI